MMSVCGLGMDTGGTQTRWALACRSALPAGVELTVRACSGHHAAARLALGRTVG